MRRRRRMCVIRYIGYRQSMSLMHGWVPLGIQLLSAVALVYAIGWRNRRWRLVSLPACAAFGVAMAILVHRLMESSGIAGEPAPRPLWPWVAATGLAVGVAVVGWPGSSWWRRNAAVFAASFCLLSSGLVVNGWIGYFPTVSTAWSQLTGRPLPGQTDLASAIAMRSDGVRPATGRTIEVTTGDAASGFRHRTEWVYLPPAWFSRAPIPHLPTVMMIGGEFNTPADWVRAGEAVATVDAFAASHGGMAPVLVFADPSGGFAVDTECVNGVRGNAADHLTKDVVPHMISTFGVSADRDQWAVAGFSSGGTCALNLAVMHPDLFAGFLAIAGDDRPNTGTDAQTVERLFGGDRDAWRAFDPRHTIARHGVYASSWGLFTVPRRADSGVDRDAAAANGLCALAASRSIACTVTTLRGRHDWPFAAAAFKVALPWLAGQVQTPGVPTSAPP